MKRPALISMLILMMLMSLATASVFAQDQAADEEVTEVDDSIEATDDAEESTDEADEDSQSEEDVAEEDLIEPVELVYKEYPCIEADGTLIDIPLGESSAEDASDGEDMDSEEAEEDEESSEEAENTNVAFGRFNLASRVENGPEAGEGEATVTEIDDTGETDETGDTEEGEIVYPDCEFIEPQTPEPPAPIINPWWGVYWNNAEFQGAPALQQRDDFVNFEWGNESPYSPTMGADYNSIRWAHSESGLEQGFYQVTIRSDFGARLDVNGARILDTIRYGNAAPFNTYFYIEGGKEYGRHASYRFDYFHHTGPSVASIEVNPMSEWASPFGYATVANGSPVLRDGPGTSYWSNGQLQTGERVKLAGHRNLASNWVFVITDDGVDGWLNTYYLSTSTPMSKLIVWPFVPDGVVGSEPFGTASRNFPYINLRYNPTSDSAVISQASPGMRLVLVGRNSDSTQLLVRMWEGTLGWASRGGVDTNHNINALPVRWVNSAEPAE